MNVRILSLGAALFVASMAAMANPGGDAAKTRELVATLQNESTPTFDKARACQQLGIIGTADAVPALSGLLAHEQLAHYAREALEAMADPAADAALRGALGTVRGSHLIGVVNSLGMRGDAQAVPMLTALAGDAKSPAASAALLALGRIGTVDATHAVRSVLTSAPQALRASAAEAALLIGDGLVKAGKGSEAAVWYDVVRSAAPSEQLKLSATRGALLAREAAAVPLLLETLRSTDAALRDVGLRAIRDLTTREVTPALVGELERFTPSVQAAVIVALVDRGDERALSAIERATAARDEGVRVAAFRALGKMGRDSSVPLLLKALASNAAAETEAAQRSLAAVQAPKADELLLGALRSTNAATRVKLIGIVGERGSPKATGPVLALARESDAAVSRAALRALGLVVRPGDLPELIKLSATLTDEEARTLADRAIYAASMKILEPERRVEPVVNAVREAKDAATRAALLRPLGAVVRAMGGSAEARAVVIAAIKEQDERVRTAAVKVLADWPDASVARELLAFVRAEPDAPQRAVAFEGVARMAADVAAGKDRTALEVVEAFTELNAVARSDEERMKVVAGLGRVKRVEGFRMLVPYLEAAAVKTEAALAIVQIAPALLGGKEGAQVKATLTRIAETEKDAEVRARAGRLLQGGGDAAKKKGAKRK